MSLPCACSKNDSCTDEMWRLLVDSVTLQHLDSKINLTYLRETMTETQKFMMDWIFHRSGKKVTHKRMLESLAVILGFPLPPDARERAEGEVVAMSSIWSEKREVEPGFWMDDRETEVV